MPPLYKEEEVKERVTNPNFQLGLATGAILGVVGGLAGHRIYARYFRRIQNSAWITPDILRRKQWIKGVVTDVGDADNFRLYHTPSLLTRVPSDSKQLRGKTIHIRMAGVDAPEAGHFGKPAQPYAEESLAWLKNRLLGKRVYCRLLRSDQYSRTVANVVVKRRFLPGTTDVCLEMLQSGWGITYDQHGAEYGPGGKEVYLKAEAEAKVARKGMWKKGVTGETPAEYKRRHASGELETPNSKKTQTDEAVSQGWFSRLWSRK
ncbi:SNase-domain-containing protein [Dendrothele bispora CBS 962.96]|uniref:SNase-domain-containing protein n=1 Tax=Dendrothele bispora (strain CBS 962.96) TaxID=1314807 RepID=A0A4S8KXV6_DENBC|nr:SNase-domain-containing protein [Dendrothele bispora CBS 962.96]